MPIIRQFEPDSASRLRPRFWRSLFVAVLAASVALPLLPAPSVQAAVLPAGFQDNVVLSGLTNPTAIEFASDGRIFVAEKSGLIRYYDSLSDPTASTFADLKTETYNFWDRGMLGMALHPSFPSTPYIYVLYARDADIGGVPPKWGNPGAVNDPCPTPPGPTADGCVVSSRLARLTATGNNHTGTTVLIDDWCQQYPSHSVGSLAFGVDGFLYVTGGDGASFSFEDHGQDGNPVNPCGDPPGGVGGSMTPPTAEGGALRSQDLQTIGGTSGAYASVLGGLSPSAYWRLGEASGTTANDSAGSNDGTYAGGVTLGANGLLVGDPNDAANFDGTNDEVSVLNATALNPTTAITVAAWIRPDSWGSSNRRIVQKHTADTQYMLRTTQSGTRLEFRIFGKSPAFTTTLPAVGQAHFVVGTYDGTRIKLYVDNVLVSNKAATGPIPVEAGGLSIGSKPGTAVTGDRFDGIIDEVSIHGVALTAPQIAQLWSAGTQTGAADPVTLDGSVLRVDPMTGAGVPGNPLFSSSDANARRIVGYGMRNPFRFTVRPGTNELWMGDVGWNTWEEINRLVTPADSSADNFGWPCYEGVGHQSAYDSANLNICEDLYDAGASAVRTPYFTYNHSAKVVPGEGCATGSSSIAGLAFYEGGPYPVSYDDALFFADYSRDCIWVMQAGGNGLPDPGQITTFVDGAANPVQLKIGLNGDLFYPDFDGGTIHRITFSGGNQPPTAVIDADPTSGPAPLTVNFDGTGSSDPELGALTYAWDLDGDGAFDDSTSPTPVRTYNTAGDVLVRLRVTDPPGATDTDSVTISVGNSPPTAVIDTPADGTTWAVGEVINFSGHATDPQQGTLPASALSWELIMHHCPSTCHSHSIQTYPGVASGSFTAPDHEYPSHLELKLTATDSGGLTDTDSVLLNPRTVVLSFGTSPSGLQLVVNATSSTAPFTRTVIVGSTNSIIATTPQSQGGTNYVFSSWSDGGAQTHTIVAPASAPPPYTATYTAVPAGSLTFIPTADSYVSNLSGNTNYGTATSIKVREGTVESPTTWRSYVKFTVSGITGPVTGVTLRLFVSDSSTDGGSVYSVATGWTETGLTFNNAPLISGSALGSSGSTVLGTYVDIPLGAGAITGNGTFSFAVKSASTNNAAYNSREFGSNPPQLVVTYTP